MHDVHQTPSEAAMERAMADVEAALSSNEADPWAESPYRWIRNLSSRKRGKAGELIIEQWLAELQMRVGRAGGSGADRTVNGHQVEIKTSTLWESGTLVWQQIRDQEYSHVVLLGIEPQRVRVWCVPKDVLRGHAVPQHTGSSGTETLWLSVDAESVPSWMEAHGGDISRAAEVVRSALR